MIDSLEFLQLDLPAMTVGVLAAIACAIPGNFLVLRKQALMGDAISHVVLPGIVLGFLISGSTATLPMLAGAASAAIIAALLIELVRRLGDVESGAAMGVVFTTMFALGVLILEQTAARDVHIDVQHALYGNIEGTVWLEATSYRDLLSIEALSTVPASIQRLTFTLVIIVLLAVAFFKELRLTTFDPALADVLGISSKLVGGGLVIISALATVAAFEAVGSILVIAMLVCPPATARMLTDHLATQVILSVIIAASAAVSGYVAAAFIPLWLGWNVAYNIAGAIAVAAGLMQVVAMIAAPRYGWLARTELETEPTGEGRIA